MKAISVFPGKPDSVHLADAPKPSLDQVPERPRRAGKSSARRRRRHRQRNQRRRIWRGAAGIRLPHHRPRGLWPGRSGRAECHRS